MTLKEIRAEYGVSQQRAAAAAGMPLRTYIRYEMNENYGDPLKRRMMVELIKEKCQINETQGVIPVRKLPLSSMNTSLKASNPAIFSVPMRRVMPSR